MAFSQLSSPSTRQERRGKDVRGSRADATLPALPGQLNPKRHCFMNASVQALFAAPDARGQGAPAERGGWHFADRGGAWERSRREPNFDALLAQTLRDAELGTGVLKERPLPPPHLHQRHHHY